MDLDRFHGLFPAQIVPFTPDNTIDETALRRVLQLNLGKGVQGFYVCGSTGEGFLMTMAERRQVLEIVCDEVGGASTVIAHIGTISTDQSIELARHAATLGVDAISAIPPFYYKFTTPQIIEHYGLIANAVDLPLIIYNIPGTTGVTFTIDELKQLFALDGVVGIKFSSSDLFLLERIKNLDPDIVVLFGSDEMSVAGQAMGADGSIGSTLNLMPEKYVQIRRLMDAEKLTEALAVQKQANAVVEALLGVGLYAGIKYGITRLGIECGVPRRPFSPLGEEQKAFLDTVFDEHL